MPEYNMRLHVALEIIEDVKKKFGRNPPSKIDSKEEFLRYYTIPDQGRLIDDFRKERNASDNQKEEENYETMVEQLQNIDSDDWDDVVYSIWQGEYEI